MKYVPQPCAEFPNDNPALHDGAVWTCAWPRAVPRAVVRAGATQRWATAQQAVVPGFSAVTEHSALAPFEPWSGVVTPARTWERVQVACLDTGVHEPAVFETAVFETERILPELAVAEDSVALPEPGPLFPMLSSESVLDAPLGDALPEVAATDPFVTDLWHDLEAGWDMGASAERCAEELSPAPVSELRLFQSKAARSDAPWNRLEVLELDLSPLPPKLRDWSEFVTQISAYLIDRGATRASVVVSSLLAGERVNLRSLRLSVRRELCAAGVAEQGPHDCYPTDTFRREAAAFHELIVRREGTGTGALDWLTRLVVGLLGGDVPESDVRVALEPLGVTADAHATRGCDEVSAAMPARAVG